MSAGKVKTQPKSQASDMSLRQSIRMEGDPDMEALIRSLDAQAKRALADEVLTFFQSDSNPFPSHTLDYSPQVRNKANAHILSESRQDMARKALAVTGKAQKRGRKSSVTRSSKSRIFKSIHSADRGRASVSKLATLKFRKSVRKSSKLSSMRVPSLGHRDGVRAQIRIPSLDRVVLSAQQVSGSAIQSIVSVAKTVFADAVHKGAVRETAMRQGVLHAAKTKSSIRKSMMQAQRRMAVLGASAVRVGMRKQALRTSVLTRGSKQQSSAKRNVGQRHHVFAMPQQAQLLAMFRAQSSMTRGRVSGETGTSNQRVAGKAKQSASMVLGAVAQQTRSSMQSKAAAPFISSRVPAVVGNRSPGLINPMLACPVPVMQEQNGRILSPDAWIDGSLYELINHIDPEIADAFFECLLKQLQGGPASLANNTLRQKANKCLKKGMPAINAITWAAMLQEVLFQAMHHVKIFDDSGIRGSAEVRADAAMLLDVDDELFSAWEDSFCMNAIAWNLSIDSMVPTEDRFPKHKEVMMSVEQQIIRRSSEAFAKDDYQSALLHTFETKVQWKAARCCALDNDLHKVASTVDMLTQMAKKDRPAVARMMTIIVRHSSINKRKMAKDIFVPRWSLDDLRHLIIKLSKEHVSIVSDNYFRSQLTAWENASLNELILNANHEHAKARMKKLSPKQPIQDFVELLEKSDQEDEVLHDIWEDIARNFSKIN